MNNLFNKKKKNRYVVWTNAVSTEKKWMEELWKKGTHCKMFYNSSVADYICICSLLLTTDSTCTYQIYFKCKIMLWKKCKRRYMVL